VRKLLLAIIIVTSSALVARAQTAPKPKDSTPYTALTSPSPAVNYTYAIRNGGFAIHNGPAYFNRPLFGTHEPSMLLSGDRPAFAYWAPTDVGKIGTLYVGLVTPVGAKWLHEATDIGFEYQPGLTRHIVQDPMIPGASLEVTAVPLSMAEGFAVRLRWISKPSEAVRLVWAFGGASGAGSGFRSPPVPELHLNESDTTKNVLQVWGNRFSLTSPTMKGKEILGTCDLEGRLETKNVREVLQGPATAERAFPSPTAVAVFAGEWPQAQPNVHLLFTMGGTQKLEQMAAQPAKIFDESVEFYRNLARRVVVQTPDPHLDLAVEAMVIASDGTWIPPTFVHGAVSWMMPYLGWRIWEGPEAFGWHDRVRSSILAFASRQIQQGDARGALPDMLDSKAVFYNMNEVFLAHLYYHYLWTGDRAFLASLLPVIEGILSWEKRRLDPDDNALYESCLNTWISDSHWYSGGDCTQASAYMFRGYQLAAEAAEAAGKDPKPFREEAERIRKAMNEKLWLRSRGHYAEFIDRIGSKRVHPEPELPTIYHPIDFGVTDQFQAYEMLRFTETNLRSETAIPNGGRLVWSSNWAPNHNKFYTHSTYELAFAEELNLAIAYYRAGQFDKAYELLKGVYASMYLGAVPGGLSCHAYVNGAQRSNEEFADSISMFARTVVEGLFGILPELQRSVIHLSPGFPEQWRTASINTPDVAYRFRKTDSEISLDVNTVRPARIHFRVPLFDSGLKEVLLEGSPARARVEAGLGQSLVDLTGPEGTRSRLLIRFVPRNATLHFRPVAVPGEVWTVRVEGSPLRELKDPQGVLGQARLSAESASGTIIGPVGWHTLFALVGGANASSWEPVNVEIRPAVEVLNPRLEAAFGRCRFGLRNNTAQEIDAKAHSLWAGNGTTLDVRLRAGAEQQFTAEGSPDRLLLGRNRLDLSGFPGLGPVSAEVLYWPEAPPNRKESWRTLPLDSFYNDSFATVLLHHFWSSEYPYPVCRDYAIDHLIPSAGRNRIPDDSRLRSSVDDRGVFLTHYGIPFAQRQQDNNLVALSRWSEFPRQVEIPVHGPARKIYLLLSAITFPIQSHIANARVTVRYADGGKSELDLVNPDNFDNGWGKFGGTDHYAANGMELLSLTQTRKKQSHSLEILDQLDVPGLVRIRDLADKWEERPHADIIDVDCDARRNIESVELEVLSNEIIVGLLGVTLLQ
jgi:hypothetical protein